MIVAVADDKCGHRQARGLPFSERVFNRTHDVLLINFHYRFLHIIKRIGHVLEDLFFGLQRCWAFSIFAYIRGWLFSCDGGGVNVVRGGYMFHLLSEGANALELAIGRSISVFVAGHRHGHRKKSSLQVHDGRKHHTASRDLPLFLLFYLSRLLFLLTVFLLRLLRKATTTYCQNRKYGTPPRQPSHGVSLKKNWSIVRS